MNREIQFILYTCFVALASWCIGAIIHVYCPTPDLTWSIESTKRTTLLYRTKQFKPKRRLLFAGGSGTVYGVSARQTENKLGIVSQNIGAHAALSAVGVASIVLNSAQSGDWVILAPEYEILRTSDALGPLTVPYLFKESSLFLMVSEPTDVLRRILLLGSPGFSLAMSGIAFRLGLRPSMGIEERDEWGDLRQINILSTPLPSVQVGHPTDAVRKVFLDLKKRLVNHGIHLFFVLPFSFVQESKMQDTLESVRQCRSVLVTIAPVLDTGPELELSNNRQDFADTRYHASKKGQQARTERIIDALRKLFSKE